MARSPRPGAGGGSSPGAWARPGRRRTAGRIPGGRACAERWGSSPRATRGKKPSIAIDSTSARDSSDWMLPPMIREPRPAIVTGQRSSGGLLIAQQLLLGRPAGEPQGAPLLGIQPRAAQLLLDVMRQRQVDVVAAEHQVIAHGHAAESRAGRGLDHRDQAEIGRAAADVADEDQLARPDLALPSVLVRDDPAIERRLGLLEQRDVRQSGLASGLERQLARGLVERCRDGQHDLLMLESEVLVVGRERGVPGVADVAQVGRRRPDRRDLLDLRRAAPGQDIGLAVDARVAEPALGAADQPAGHACPLDPGELADDPIGALVPGQVGRAGGQLVLAGQIEERGQHRPGRRLGRRDELGDGEVADVGRRTLAPLRVDVRDRAVGRAQVDPDEIA